jgi:hypothetical protein
MTDEAISPLRRRMMRINQSLHHLVIRANTRLVMQFFDARCLGMSAMACKRSK